MRIWKRLDGMLSRRFTTVVAVLGMTSVLLLLAGFANWSSQTTEAGQREAARSSRVSFEYQKAQIAAIREQAIQDEYRLAPDTGLRAEYTIQTLAYRAALDNARASGDHDDAAFTTDLVAKHVGLTNLASSMFTALDLGTSTSADLAALSTRLDSQLSQIESELSSASASANSDADHQLALMDGVDRFISTTTPVAFAAGLFLMVMLGGIVVAYRRRVEQQAAEADFNSMHDTLTGLPNRALFRDRGERALATVRRHGGLGAVMMLDLDRFKEINDTLGHHHGDELLKQVGARIAGALRKADTVARLGGDEFTILLPEVASSEAAAGVADKIARALEVSFVVEGVTMDMEVSVGIAVYPEHGPDTDSLLQHADIAMYQAKRNHTRIATYSDEFDGSAPRRLALLGELRRAIEMHELVVHYQPKVDMTSRAVIGVEALLRWQHPELGLIPPSDFIPLAERTGLIHPLTKYVLSDALQQAHRWAASGSPLPVAVNISARSLLTGEFPDEVAQLLADWKVPANLLELEITENTLMGDPTHARDALLRLREMGVTLSIDDFGTGYSSLSYLNQLPVQAVKIDRSFITHLAEHSANRLIVTSIVGLGRDLGMKVIAEGVETEEAWTELAELGCDIAQGYLLTRPMPPQSLELWLASWSARTNPSRPAVPHAEVA